MCAAGVEGLVLMSVSRLDAVLLLPAERRWHFRLRPKSSQAPVAVTCHCELVPHRTVNDGGASVGLVVDGTRRKYIKLMPAVSIWILMIKRMPQQKVELIGREGRGGGNYH